MNNGLKKNHAFTLVELVIAVTISSIVFLWLLSFVWDTLSELSRSNKTSKLIVSLDEVMDRLEWLSSIYEKKTLIINTVEWEWTDVLLLSNSWSTWAIIFGLVDPDTDKIFTGSLHYSQYNKKHLWYRRLDWTELSTITSTPSELYNLTFQKDKIYSDLYIKDLQIGTYNTGTYDTAIIIDLEISLLLKYDVWKDWIEWVNLGNDNLYNINLNF